MFGSIQTYLSLEIMDFVSVLVTWAMASAWMHSHEDGKPDRFAGLDPIRADGVEAQLLALSASQQRRAMEKNMKKQSWTLQHTQFHLN